MHVAQIDDADRKSADEFGADHEMTGKAFEARYAATGDLDCAWGSGQAQLTVKNETIVTAAHNLDQALDCKKNPVANVMQIYHQDRRR